MIFKKDIEKFRKKIIDKVITLLSKESNNSFLDQPLFVAKLFSGFIVASSTIGLIWLGTAKTDQIIQSNGFLEPKDRLRSVKIPEKGIIDDLFIKEGELVQKGQVLLSLDTDLLEINSKTTSNAIDIKNQILEEKEIELKKTREIFNIKIVETEKSIEIEKDILHKMESIVKDGAISEMQYLEKRIELIKLQSQLDEFNLDKIRKISLIQQSIKDLRMQVNDLQSKLTEIKKIKKINQIKSPINGFIHDLKPFGKGYVANSTETILKIVPRDNLIAIIDINTSDIGFVKIGKEVDLSIDSFPAKDFGSLKGKLIQISSTALEPNDTNRKPHFKAKVSLQSQKLETKKGIKLGLKPGMSLSASIKLRKATYLDLLLGTFKDKTRSLNKL
tara:strand:- start:3277 stop:4440 length:1164 start_codon:yes stop_codon:yes gene_type:complete